MIDLCGPSELVFRVDPGVLDKRALLAFSTGQCHGLALVAAATDWLAVSWAI